jgi:hypothetical protein
MRAWRPVQKKPSRVVTQPRLRGPFYSPGTFAEFPIRMFGAVYRCVAIPQSWGHHRRIGCIVDAGMRRAAPSGLHLLQMFNGMVLAYMPDTASYRVHFLTPIDKSLKVQLVCTPRLSSFPARSLIFRLRTQQYCPLPILAFPSLADMPTLFKRPLPLRRQVQFIAWPQCFGRGRSGL